MKTSVVIEKDADGFFAWCPELKGWGKIREAIALYPETLDSKVNH